MSACLWAATCASDVCVSLFQPPSPPAPSLPPTPLAPHHHPTPHPPLHRSGSQRLERQPRFLQQLRSIHGAPNCSRYLLSPRWVAASALASRLVACLCCACCMQSSAHCRQSCCAVLLRGLRALPPRLLHQECWPRSRRLVCVYERNQHGERWAGRLGAEGCAARNGVSVQPAALPSLADPVFHLASPSAPIH